MGVLISHAYLDFNYFRCISRYGIAAGLNGNSNFNFFEKAHLCTYVFSTVFLFFFNGPNLSIPLERCILYEVNFHYYVYFCKGVCACISKNEIDVAHSIGLVILLDSIIPRLFIYNITNC